MQTLLLHPSLMALLGQGDERTTVRKGVRDVVPGPLRFACAQNTCDPVDVTVVRVEVLPFQDIPLRDILNNGSPNHADMLRGMLAFYPDMDEATVCTVVAFRS